MMPLSQSSAGVSRSDSDVELWALFILGGLGAWALLRWLTQGARSPDPWNETVAAEIEKKEATPIRHRCLTPHQQGEDFCPTCGVCVGQYTNWLPYPYVFSLGHTLRLGTSGDFKRSKLTVLGFML